MKRLHNLFMLAVSLVMIIHLILADVHISMPWYGNLGYFILLMLSLGLFLWSKIRRKFLPTLQIASIQQLADVTLLRMLPGKTVHFRPGQFAFLQFVHPALPAEFHPFSFLGTPGEDIAFCIKASGDFTSRIRVLNKDDTARVDGSYGASLRIQDVSHPLCFIATGVGIVPFIGIIKYLLTVKKVCQPILLFEAAKSKEYIPELETLGTLAKTHTNFRFKILLKSNGDPRYSLPFFIKELTNYADWRYYICTNKVARITIVRALKYLNVKSSAIRSENFGF